MYKMMRMAALLAVLTMMSVPVFAQGGNAGGRQGGAGGRQGGGGPFSLASVPVKALTTLLKLSPEQATKIQAIQDKQRQVMQEMRQGQGGGAPDPQAQAAMRTKIADSNKLAAGEIEKILTADQAATVKSSLRLWTVVSGMGFSIEIADSLKLTEEQLVIMEKALKERQAQQGQGRRGGGN